MVLKVNLISTSKGKKMKTFKQHVKEAHGYMGDAQGVGVAVQNSAEDGSMGAHNIHDPEVLKQVNSFVGSIGCFISQAAQVDPPQSTFSSFCTTLFVHFVWFTNSVNAVCKVVKTCLLDPPIWS